MRLFPFTVEEERGVGLCPGVTLTVMVLGAEKPLHRWGELEVDTEGEL